MSAQFGFVATVGFALEVILTIVEKGGPSLDAVFNGMLGALGAIFAKGVYEFVKNKIKKYNERKI